MAILVQDQFIPSLVDMEKFHKTPCCGYVLQFLILANDVDALVELNRMRKRPSSEEPSFYANLWARGSLTYLQRQNISIVFECLDATVSKTYERVAKDGQPLVAGKTTKKPKILWSLIKQDSSLFDKLAELESFRQSSAYKIMDAVRDKLGAHADIDALKAGLKSVIAADDAKFGVFALSNNGQFRAFFADDILVEQNIQLLAKGQIELKEFPDIFGTIKDKLVRFTVELMNKFCEENDLFPPKDVASAQIKKINELKEFRFL